MSPISQSSLKKLIFIDTNDLHYARIYLKFSEKHDLKPVGQSRRSPDNWLKKELSGSNLKGHIRGKKVVEYLARGGSLNNQIEYAPISYLELVAGMLRGKAILNAAEEEITSQMWSNFREKEIYNRLDNKSFLAVTKDSNDIQRLFQLAGISIIESDPSGLKDVWKIAKSLLSNLYFEVGDSVVYASALIAQADEILSHDKYFKMIGNRVKYPGYEKDQTKKRNLQSFRVKLINILSRVTAIPSNHITLPVISKIN